MPGIVLGSLFAHLFLTDYEVSLLDPFLDEQTEVEGSNLPPIQQLVSGVIPISANCTTLESNFLGPRTSASSAILDRIFLSNEH